MKMNCYLYITHDIVLLLLGLGGIIINTMSQCRGKNVTHNTICLSSNKHCVLMYALAASSLHCHCSMFVYKH